MIPKNLKNFSLFVNGKGYAGLTTELSLPKLALKVESYRGAGMDLPIQIDMGMETLTGSFTLAEYNQDVLTLFGLIDGSKVNLTFRGALDDGSGTPVPIVVNLTGTWQEMDFGSWQAGNIPNLKVSVNAIYYKLTMNSKVLVEIDAINMIRNINGKDQMANFRKVLNV